MTVCVCMRLGAQRFRQQHSPNAAVFHWSKWNYFSGLHQKGITNADDVRLSKGPSWCTVILNWLRVYEPASGVSRWSELYKEIIILMLLKISKYDCAFCFVFLSHCQRILDTFVVIFQLWSAALNLGSALHPLYCRYCLYTQTLNTLDPNQQLGKVLNHTERQFYKICTETETVNLTVER